MEKVLFGKAIIILSDKTWPRLLALLFGCALLSVSVPASAYILQLDFSGTIFQSVDNAGTGETVGRLFGQYPYLTATPGQGQVGKTISGRVYIDDSIYSDTAPQSNIGSYYGTANAFRSIYTIDGKTFDTNWFQDIIGAPYSAEQAALYDPTNINQDFFTFSDVEAYKPIWNQGAYGSVSLSFYLLSNQAVQNFLNSVTFDQIISLDASELSNMTKATGSYELYLYCGWMDDLGLTAGGNGQCPVDTTLGSAPFGENFDSLGQGIGPSTGSLTAQSLHAAGDFNLTSFSLQRVPDPVPEPATMILLGAGLFGLAGTRRRFKK